MHFAQQIQELQRLGFEVRRASEYERVYVKNVWHWDVMATNMTYIVYLRATGPLSWQNVEFEISRMTKEARSFDKFPLPVGFQHGRVLVPVFIADAVEPGAVAVFESATPVRFAVQVFPVAMDKSTGRTHFLRSTRIWGAAYTPKLQFLAKRLLEPATTPTKEPASVLGIILTVMVLLSLLLSCGMLVFVAVALRSY